MSRGEITATIADWVLWDKPARAVWDPTTIWKSRPAIAGLPPSLVRFDARLSSCPGNVVAPHPLVESLH